MQLICSRWNLSKQSVIYWNFVMLYRSPIGWLGTRLRPDSVGWCLTHRAHPWRGWGNGRLRRPWLWPLVLGHGRNGGGGWGPSEAAGFGVATPRQQRGHSTTAAVQPLPTGYHFVHFCCQIRHAFWKFCLIWKFGSISSRNAQKWTLFVQNLPASLTISPVTQATIVGQQQHQPRLIQLPLHQQVQLQPRALQAQPQG